PGVVDRGGHAVGLHTREEEAHRDDGDDREEDRVEQREAGSLVLVGLLEVVGRAAAVLAGVRVLLLVDLAEGALDEGGGRAEEGGGPHREPGGGAAEGDRGGDAADVAHADAAREGHHQRLEGGGAVGGGLSLLQLVDHVGEVPDLEQPGADGEVEADDEEATDEGEGPDQPVGAVDEFGDHECSWGRGSDDTLGVAPRRDRGHHLMVGGTYRTTRALRTLSGSRCRVVTFCSAWWLRRPRSGG